MEHTILANGIRQGHKGGLVLSQLHIGLAVGFAIVACLTAFGGGIIVGMWYKVGEQIAPASPAVTSTPAESPTQGQEAMSQPPGPPAPVTFYNTLTNSNVAYAPLTPPPATNGPSGGAKGAIAPAPAPGPTSGAKAASASSAPARGAGTSSATGSTKAVSASKATSAAGEATQTATVSESQKHTKATSAAKAAPAETAVSPGGTKTAAQKPAAPTRQGGKETGAQQHAGAAAPAKAAPGAEERSAEKGAMARVQPAAVPGQGSQYRIRIGGYAERTAADQTAQRLTVQEQVPAIVAGRD